MPLQRREFSTQPWTDQVCFNPWSHVVNSQNKREPSAMDLSGLVVGISYKMQVMSVRESPPAERSVELGDLSVGERLSKPELFSVRGR